MKSEGDNQAARSDEETLSLPSSSSGEAASTASTLGASQALRASQGEGVERGKDLTALVVGIGRALEVNTPNGAGEGFEFR